MRALVLFALSAAAMAVPVAKPAAIRPRAFTPLKVGAVTPKGWLLKQLQLQADGLSGHLSMFWNDIQNSIWIGGNGDGGLHERAPYWLNGIVPLAYLLKNAGVDTPQRFAGIYKVRDGSDFDGASDPVSIVNQSNKYVDYILAHQDPTTGWLGPADNVKDGNTYWGRSNVILSLCMYAEAEPTKFDTVSTAILKYLLELNRRLTSPDYSKLAGWAAARWIDIALGAQWALVNAPQGHEAELESLITTLHDQGSDWETWFETFQGGAGGHNVNNAQALKSAAVWFLMTGNATLAELSQSRMDNLDAHYGLPTGMFNGDEILPAPATRLPSRGIELCGVVEAMFSYNTMFSVHGNVAFADRSERIAFNALPATWASPTGGDMWAHQYLQAVNQINAKTANPHVWAHDGPDAELYGLEPNYGCCTANFNQGWPKWASMVVYATSDGGAAIGLYAPSISTLPDGSTVDIETNYPYEDEVQITVDAKAAMPLYVRVPGWAVGTTINGKSDGVKNGTMYKFPCAAGKNVVTVTFQPEIEVQRWGDLPADGETGPVSVHRGPLMFSLPISGNYTVLAHHYGGIDDSNDYQMLPTSDWQYALDVDMGNPSKTLSFKSIGYQAGTAPFNHTGWPVTISATLRPLPTWGEAINSAAKPPASPACTGGGKCGDPVQVELVRMAGLTSASASSRSLASEEARAGALFKVLA
eukprot:CAMPEP_0182927302 /NCGR_PEP_ID=MMETSP0105_2-20130417/13716_1 /TAXON_ID=81532 ORGANISM="Acanthoeca-like sp., Strain 10tr" /NCGR_SAMPLE_ID=MMETSP0105_2 /ASSEMBLY_ACC=CAM_ASM_000205 /LENGTH=698 /DNA_ID=CAMNT_0025065247 /DNA_START=1 /DNA_END=2095 /DNA_ORIENTATION=+